jgi:nuclear transport factor 2 (NTF2) superfamily protein
VRKIWCMISMLLLVAQMAMAQKKASIADSWVTAWNSHDADKVTAIFTTDGRHSRVCPRALRFLGRLRIRL